MSNSFIQRLIFLSLFLAFASKGYAGTCLVKSPGDFQKMWSGLEKGDCEKLLFTGSMVIELDRPLTIPPQQAPVWIGAAENARVTFRPVPSFADQPALTIKAPQTVIENLTFSDFPRSAIVADSDDILLKCLELSGNEYGITVAGKKTRIEGTAEKPILIHHNRVAGILLPEASHPHTFLLSHVSFYANGPEGAKRGIITEGAEFPRPRGVVLAEDLDEILVVEGYFPLLRDPAHPWRLGVVHPKNIRIDIYSSSPGEQDQGKIFVGSTDEVAEDGNFRVAIPKKEFPKIFTAIATDLTLNVSSGFSFPASEGEEILADSDGDGLSDADEIKLHLDPHHPDSDNDCLPDGLESGVSEEALLELKKLSERAVPIIPLAEKCGETTIYFDGDPTTTTDPARADSDGDGIEDGEEDKNKNGKVDGETGAEESDPGKKDSDDDGLHDGDEKELGTNPVNPDTDGDGAQDGLEVHRLRSDPLNVDSDGDGLEDGVEAAIPNLDPTKADSDLDGLKDGEEDANQNGWVDFNETDPAVEDSDGDGLKDGLEKNLVADSKSFLTFDLSKLSNGPKCSPPIDKNDVDCDGFPNGRDEDADNDGCLDQEEGLKDQNENGILDVWEQGVKGCGASSNGSSSTPTNFSGSPKNNAEPQSKDVVPSAEVLPARGGGACQLTRSQIQDPKSQRGILVLLFLLSIFILRNRFREGRVPNSRELLKKTRRVLSDGY